MTGRAAGMCAGYTAPGYMSRLGRRLCWGRGAGWSRSGGWGRRNWYRAAGLPGWGITGSGRRASSGKAAPFAEDYPPAPGLTARQELDALEGQAKHLEEALGDINRRIGELKSQKGP